MVPEYDWTRRSSVLKMLMISFPIHLHPHVPFIKSYISIILSLNHVYHYIRRADKHKYT